MALHEHTPEEQARIQQGQQVPEGAVGAAIEDEGPGKIKEFFTNPANLATLLVLGTALSKQRKPGQSGLNQALTSGVGALAFRGGLTQGVRAQGEASAEAASVVTGREATAANQQAQVAAVNTQTTSRSADTAAQIESQEGISAAEISSREQLARQAQVMQGFLDAANNYPNVVRDLTLSGLEPPTYDEYLLQVAKAAALGGATGGPEFRPDPTEVVIPGPLTDTGEAAIAADAAAVNARIPLPTVPARNRHVRQHIPRIVGRALRNKIPEIVNEMSDDQIMVFVEQQNAEVEAQLATLSPEDARAILIDKLKKAVLSIENIQALRNILATPRDVAFAQSFQR